MNISNKIVVLFFTSVVILIAVLMFFRQTQEKQNKMIVKSAAEQQVILINTAIKVHSDQLDELVTDYSNWDDLVLYLKKPDQKWATDNIASIIQSFRLFSVSVYDENVNLVYGFGNLSLNIFGSNIVRDEVFNSLLKKGFIHYFQGMGDDVLEISGSTIHLKADSAKVQPSAGFFIVSRIWNRNFLQELELTTASTVKISDFTEPTSQVIENDSLIVYKALVGYDNQKIKNLVVKKANNIVVNFHQVSDFLFNFLGSLLIVFLAIFFLILYRWIRRPLKIISESLRRGTTLHLDILEKNKDEFSQIARLISVFNQQKLELERENTEINRIQKELIKQGSILRGLAIASNHLLTNVNIDLAIGAALETVCNSAGIDHVFICRNVPENTFAEKKFKIAFTYTLPGISNNLNIGECEAFLNQLTEEFYLPLSEGQIVKGFSDNPSSNFREFFVQQQINSIMVVPVIDKVHNDFLGFIGFADSLNDYTWTNEDEALLSMLANNIGEAIRRHKSQEDLHAALALAKNADRAKSEFLASMSHEIRTPMNGVIGMTSLLSLTELTNAQRDYVNIIENSGESLMSIINEILDFSKIESGKIELEESSFDLRVCIEDVFDLVAQNALEKHLDIIYYIDTDVQQYIYGDGFRLRQILVNLVSNAIKFTEKGDIYIHVSLASNQESKVVLEFSVKDTGIGIPANKINSLFTPFMQVDTSTTRKYGGTGLGLAISGSLVKLMNGKFWVTSVEGEGSDFHFTITTSFSPPEKESGTTYNMLSAIPGKSVLIVDDNATNRKVLTLQCEYWGLKSASAASGIEALKLLEKNTYDVGILDMQMPNMDGVMLARAIRTKYSIDELPLIMLTSVGFNTESSELKKLFSYYVNKPIKHTQLAEILMKTMSYVKKTAVNKPLDFDMLSDISKKYPFSILVVEDNNINQKLISNVFRILGYKTDIAANGIEALEAIKRKSYDLIFMDIQMPLMNGYDATRIIVERTKEERPLIIAMTANAMTGDREKCMEAGMDDYITKPMKIEVLKNVIQLWGDKKFTNVG